MIRAIYKAIERRVDRYVHKEDLIFPTAIVGGGGSIITGFGLIKDFHSYLLWTSFACFLPMFLWAAWNLYCEIKEYCE